MTQLHPVALKVNGVSYKREVESRLLLSDFLRHELGLTGTHVGCEHGVCGACTILFDGQSIRSCLIFAVQANGHSIMTVEGLAFSILGGPRKGCILCNRHFGKHTVCSVVIARQVS